ncbi:MAG: 16S rRNA (adenine(1518)-N(6)/adenine(1519)-N(6))-dimethyltransferase RsmA [Halobacteriales archaeon]|nr:16S rRNA (adenine(1518)-N(6)/adenine(1519)-N(6))-dimethyltransferase RsmA [Halobacteriales archaeon]
MRRPKLGQHFLIDRDVVQRQVAYAQLRGDETVLEIGPGKGVLTHALAPHVKKLVCIEKDPEMVDELTDHGLPPNVRLILGDALKEELPGFDKVVSNLPYHISSDITFRLLERDFEMGVLMFQREFAQRMVARPGTDHYGRLSVNAHVKASIELLETVPPSAFHPRPRVASSLVRLTPRPAPPFDMEEPELFEEVVRAAFQHRRKTLRNALLDQWPAFTKSWDLLHDAVPKLPHMEARAGTLTPKEFNEVAEALAAAVA